MFSYYRRFIKDFAAIAAPLHALTKQERSGQSQRTLKKEAKTTWSEGVWTEEHQKECCLAKTDTGVLRQTHPSWQWALSSANTTTTTLNTQSVTIRKLIDTETRWSIWELELGAVVWASTLYRPYLRGVHFELVTDSKVVAALLTKDTRPRG